MERRRAARRQGLKQGVARRFGIVELIIVVALVAGTVGIVVANRNPYKSAFAGLIVAGVTASYGQADRRRLERRASEEAERHALDETRRLLYMARLGNAYTVEIKYDLAGTLANSLAHHSRILSRPDALALGDKLMHGYLQDDTIQPLISYIENELRDHAPAQSVALGSFEGFDTAHA